MARSKEQWKAQQRALHTQPQSKSFFQMKRSVTHQPGVRPMAPPANSALFQLGRPVSGAPPPVVVAPVRPVVLKPDPIQMTPNQTGNSSGQAIDLTLDDDEEEDEPMGTQQPVTATTDASAVSSAASDSLKLSMLDGVHNDTAAVAQSLQQTETMPDMMVPLAEDVESDVDEDWPVVPQPGPSSALTAVTSSVPQSGPSTAPAAVTSAPQSVPLIPASVNEQASHTQTKEDILAALDAIRKTISFPQDRKEGSNVERNTQMEATSQQTSTPPLYGDEDEGTEVEVDEELPNAAKTGEDSSGSPTTADRIVRVDNLEDGEIFEEGVAAKPTMQVPHAMMRGNISGQFEAHTVDTMGVRSHLRTKKQKKRGKKKTKRKLGEMQMMHTPPGEVPPEFERTTRQRPFADAPPPGQYTFAMMRNGPRGEPMSLRPVFQDPIPAPFRPVVGGLHPPMRPSPQQLQTPPLPPPPPYEDSQILRVNRQGNMKMLDGEIGPLRHMVFAEPPMQGGFKYRSVSMSPPKHIPGAPSHSFQRSVSDQSRLPPIPPSSRGGAPVPNRERDNSEDFDLDSLRAAALRSKVKRSVKASPSTPTSLALPDAHSSFSSSVSSPKPTENEEKQSKPASPESENELRLKILQSMTRNRKRTFSKGPNTVQVPTPPVNEADTVERQTSDCASSVDGNEDEAANEISSATQTDSITSKELAESTLPKASNVAQPATTTLEQNEARDKIESPSGSATGSTKPSVEVAVTALESPSGSASGSSKPSVEVVVTAPQSPSVTAPEFRPLTACSQSLVIRLSPEDFSPRKGGGDAHMKAKASSSLQDAIKEMRRKIAEREKEQTNRLLENAAARLTKQPSGSSSSPASLSSTPHQLSPRKKVSTASAQSSGATVTFQEVSFPATEIANETPATATPEEAVAKDCGNMQAKISEGKEKPVEHAPPSEVLVPAETAPENKSSEKPALETQECGDTSGGVSTLAITDGVRAEKSCDVPVVEKPISTDASIPGSDYGELDFDAIRAEYDQCVTECKEADMHIAQLSNEMAQLEKQLPPAGSTVGGP